MLQQEKVILMTRLAMEEKTHSRYRFITGSFWFDDYAAKELWEAFFAITFAYALVVLLGLVAYGDTWTVTYHIADALALGKKLLDIWLILLAFGILICLLVHVSLYREAFRKRQRVEKYLRHLLAIYEDEEAEAEVLGEEGERE